MPEFIITEEPLFDRSGRQVGVDRIRRHVVQPAEVPIPEGQVRVHCACGATHLMPETQWKRFLAVPEDQKAAIKQGRCDCALLSA